MLKSKLNKFAILFASIFFATNLYAQKDLVISGGNTVSSFVCENKTAFVWGSNSAGQLGLHDAGGALITTDPITTPTAITKFNGLVSPPDVKQINSGSGSHFVAITCTGDVWAWGVNGSGQIGIGSAGGVVTIPTRVIANAAVAAANRGAGNVLQNAAVVYSGTVNTFAILQDGKLVSWGGNSGTSTASDGSPAQAGQLGQGTTTDTYTANYVLTGPGAPLTGVIQIFAGDNVGYALVDPDGDGVGTVYSWGFGLNGTLGRNATGTGNPSAAGAVQDSYARPVYYATGTQMNNITQLQAGDVFGIALDVDGYVWTWGNGGWNNATGNTTINYTGSDPRKVIAGTTTGASNDGTFLLAKAIGGGQGYGMAVSVDGKPVAWGGTGLCANGGMTGVGNTTAAIPPTYIQYAPGLVHNNVTLINRGDTWGFYGTANNELYAWGCNNFGQLGIGSTTNQTRATLITPPTGCSLRDPAPTVNLTPGDTKVCPTFSLVLNSGFVPNAGLGASYQIDWYKGAVTLPNRVKTGLTSVAGNLTYTAIAPGTYTVIIKYVGTKAGCNVYEDAMEDVVLTVIPEPTIVKKEFCGDIGKVQLTPDPSDPAGVKYNWYATPASVPIIGTTVGSTLATLDVSGIAVDGSGNKTVYYSKASLGNGLVFRQAQTCAPNYQGQTNYNSGTGALTTNLSNLQNQGYHADKAITITSMQLMLQTELNTDGAILNGNTTFQVVGAKAGSGGLVEDPTIVYGTLSSNFTRTKIAADPQQLNQQITLAGNASVPANTNFFIIVKTVTGTVTGTVASFARVSLGQCENDLTFPMVDNFDGVSVSRTSSSNNNGSNGGGKKGGIPYNVAFDVTNPTPCARVAVILVPNCPCTKPTAVAITAPATSPKSLCEGTSQTLSGTATVGAASINGGFTYSWRKTLPTLSVLNAPTVTALTIGTATAVPSNSTAITGLIADAGTYVLRIEDGNTGNAACYTEATVVINVNPKPTITSSATGSVCSGIAQNYTITSSVASSYVWSRAVVAGISNAVATAQTANPITEILTNTTTAPVVVRYIITPTSTAGSCPGTPFNYDVTVNPKPVISSANTGTVCSGIAQNYDITSVVASSYVWSRAVVAGISNAVATGQTADPITEILTNTTTAPVVVRYIITPTSTAGTCLGTPFNYDVTVNPKPVISSANTGTVCTGIAQNYDITSVVASSYSWSRAVVAGISNAVATGQTADPITEILTNTTTAPVVVRYIITPTSTAGTCLGTPFNYDVTVNPVPTISSANTGSVCSGIAQNYTITSSVASSYVWSRAVVAGISNAVATAQTANPITEILTNTTTAPVVVRYIITPTSTAGSCPGTPFNYDVTVNPKPVISSANTGTVCSGIAQNYDITSVVASSYVWSRAVVAGISNAVATGQTADPITEILTNTTTAPVVVRYIITPTSTAGTCLGTPFNYDVTVNPKPVISSANTGTVCTGIAQNYDITSVVASSYSWSRAVVAGISNAVATGQTADPITEILTNTTTAPVVVRYIITPTSTAGTCLGTPFNYDVTVNPVPTISSANTGSVCSGVAQNYAITSNVASSYGWTRAAVTGISNPANTTGTGTPITEILTNTTSAPQAAVVVRYIITPTSTTGSCAGTPFNYDVTVNPKLVPSVAIATPSTTICTGTSITFTATPTNGGAATYVWRKNTLPIVPAATGSTYTTTTAANGDSYDVVMTSTALCANPTTATSTPIVITVTTVVTPAVSITVAPSNTICAGTSVTFTASPGNGGSLPTYEWFIRQAPAAAVSQGAPSSALGADKFTRNNLANGDEVSVKMVSNSGCVVAPGTATSNVITMVVTPNVTPTATLVADKTTICPGDLVKYTASSTNGGTATYAWSGTPTAAGTGATYSTTALTSPNSVTVTVTSSLTCVTSATAVSNAVVVTVNPALTPAVSISAATTPATSPTTICTNGSVTFTAGPTNEGAGPSYEWFINSVSKQVGASATFTTTELTASTDVVKVVLTSNAICVSPATANASMSIIVNAGITAGSIGSVQTICYGGSPAKLTELTASSAVTPSYVWEEATLAAPATFVTVTGGTVSNGGKDFTPPMLTSGMYYRRAVTDGSAPAPCNKAISNSVLITVRSELVAGVIGTSASTCSGKPTSPMSETTLPTGGEGAGSYTYQWQSSSTGAVGSFSNIPSGTGSTYNAGSLTQTMYYQLIETSGTCGSVPTNIVTKTISAPEVITLSLNDPGTVCSGPFASINFTATADNGSGSGTLSYVWTLAGNPVGTNSANYTLTPLVATDNGKVVKVVVSTSNGCNAGDQTKSVVLSITNAVTPTVSISTPHNPNCAGFVSTFTANSTDGGSSASYQWYVIPAGGTAPGTAVGSGGTVYSTSSLEQGEKVYVELTSSLGCLSTANPFKSNEILMNIKPIPTPMISEQDTIICSPNSVVFHGLVASGTTNSYQWKLGDKNIAAPQGTTRNYVASESGLYSLNEDNGTCNTTSQQVRLTVIPKPVANAGADIYIKEGDLGYLNGSGGSIYNWSPATHLSDANGSTPSFRGVETLTYVLTVADATNTCKDTDEVTVFVVKPIRVPNVITVNGDGTNDDWEIENIEGYPNSIIEIYNRWGNLVWKSEGYPKNWDGTNFRNGQVLPDGTYFYIINLQSQIYDEPNTGWVQIVK